MVYKIEGKEIQVIFNKEQSIYLPNDFLEKVNQNFESMIKRGLNIWNGEIICVSECRIEEDRVEIICKKSNYAHYLYGEKYGCPQNLECRNLSAGCLIETADGYYVVGELEDNTSYPKMLQVPGGNIDKSDILSGKIDIEQTIIREVKEEINIDLKSDKDILYSNISYIYISGKEEQPGVELFSKAKIKMKAQELKAHFENYYRHLKDSELEIEFKELHFLKKEKAVEELEKLDNPKRNYLTPLLKCDLKQVDINYEDER